MKKKNKTKMGGKYSALYLGLALAAVLLLEGVVMSTTASADWQNGLEVLDISKEVQVVSSDMFALAEPLFMVYDAVNTFYQMAATEMIVMLDISDTDPFAFIRGVNQFYKLASIEMEKLVDFSSQFESIGQVAGAYISR